MTAERLYRALLRLYPVRFREQYERELLLAFRDERPHWPRILADLLLTVPARLAEEAAQDLRHSLRVHARRPFVAIFSVTALALAIGAATGLFAVLDAMLWRTLPYTQADRLVVLHSNPGTGKLAETPKALHDWTARNAYLQDATVFLTTEYNVSSGSGVALRLPVCETSANLFGMMGVPMAWGRSFLPEEETPGRNQAAVISHALWDQAFGADPRVLGRTIRLNGVPFHVVGVAPAGFDYPSKSQIWTPTVFDFDRVPKEGVLFWKIFGRLKDGIPYEQARTLYHAEAALTGRRAAADEANRPDLRPLQLELAGPARHASLVLFAAVLCVLLIACGNVANLLLTRVLDRRRELQVRAALGASRARLFQQLLFESLALSAAAGLLGLAVALGVTRLAAKVWPDQPPAPLDWRILAFACALSLLTGLVFGVLPAWHVSRLQSTNTTLRAGAARAPGTRLRLVLTGVQVLLTLVLLTGGVQLGRLLFALVHADTGYDTRGVATLRVSLTGTPRDQGTGKSEYTRQALARLLAIPGVESAAAVDCLPLAPQPIGMGSFRREDGRESGPAMVTSVSSGYFATLRIPIVAGRTFRPAESEPVALLTERTAAELGGPAAVLGRTIESKILHKPMRVIGIARTILHFGPGSEPLGQIYVPLDQTQPGNLTFVLKTRGDRTHLLAAARPALASVDTQVPVYAVQSMDAYLAERLAQPRLYTGLLAAFGLFAAFLAILGLYATVSCSVAQRTHELGVRLALGGTPARLRRLILGQSMPVVLGALAAGATVALALGKVLTALIYQAKAIQWTDCALAALPLAATTALAVHLAARRVTRLDPARVLRSE